MTASPFKNRLLFSMKALVQLNLNHCLLRVNNNTILRMIIHLLSWSQLNKTLLINQIFIHLLNTNVEIPNNESPSIKSYSLTRKCSSTRTKIYLTNQHQNQRQATSIWPVRRICWIHRGKVRPTLLLNPCRQAFVSSTRGSLAMT